jgi:hypothetical protein
VRIFIPLIAALLWTPVHSQAVQAVPSTPVTPVNLNAQTAGAPSVGSLLVTLDDPKAGSGGTEVLSAAKDIAEANAVAEVTFGEPVALAPGTQQRRWLLPFKVVGLPAGTTQTRYVRFQIGATGWALPYQITSPPSPTVTWSLKPPPAANRQLDSSSGLPIGVAVDGRSSVSGVQLKPLDLIEQGTMRSLADVGWRLCRTPELCEPSSAVTALDSGPNSLWVVPVSSLPPGRYVGSVTVASVDKPAGESVSLTLNVSSLGAKTLGFVFILVGVGFGLWIGTFMRRRAERDQLLLGPSALLVQIDRLSDALHADDLATVPEIDRKIERLRTALTETALETAGLPPKVPMPWPVSTDGYRKYVEAQSATFNALQAIVETGVLALLALRHEEESRDGPLDPDEELAFIEAMKAINAMADWSSPPDPAGISGLTRQHLQAFKDAIQDSRTKGVRLAANVPAGTKPRRIARLRTPGQLRLQIRQTSVLAWAVLGAVTATAGTYVLVLTNPGFGTYLDLFACFLWGVGLPAGATLATSNTSTVSTALGMTR